MDISMLRGLIGGLSVALLFCAGCEGEEMEPIVARLCYVVEVADQPARIEAFRTGRQLEPLIKKFADSEGLDSLHRPGEIRRSLFWAKAGVMVVLAQATGHRHAWMELYRDELVDPGIDERFTEFLYSEIGQDFTVFPCTDIEGAQLPVLHSWKLR